MLGLALLLSLYLSFLRCELVMRVTPAYSYYVA